MWLMNVMIFSTWNQWSSWLRQIFTRSGKIQDKILADAGYCSQANFEYMDQPDSADSYIAVKKDHKQCGVKGAASRGRIPKDMSLKGRMNESLGPRPGKHCTDFEIKS